jgi:DNA-binding GntR family transcriptional regulator
MAEPNARRPRPHGGKDDVHATLVKEILDGTLAPGTPLSERSLVDRFMISRTPIRQVLWQLERDDLIEMHPHRGAFVKKLGIDDVGDLFQLRESLEPLASALAAQRRPEDGVRAVIARFRVLEKAEDASASQLVQLGGDLHDAIVQWSGNRMLLRIYRAIHMQTHLMRNLLHGSLGSEWVSFREHVAILDAIERRDPQAAHGHMSAHLRRAREAVLEHLFGQVPGPEAARAPEPSVGVPR